MRTSLTHPIAIAEVRPAIGSGTIGITFCPGKVQHNSRSGPWERDLSADLNAIAAWNAAAVVSLVEEHELQDLQVEGLGQQVRARHMCWYHMPIRDVSVPSPAFEDAWHIVGQDLRSMLRNGANVLVHCKGGLGRAGTIAARLLVELGWDAIDAIHEVRRVRPGAIETSAQEEHVLKTKPLTEIQPSSESTSLRDRAMGTMLGLAVGDAIGTTLEFTPRDAVAKVTDVTGGGPFRLKPGEWTDDTSMALALMDSLLVDPSLNERDLMERFSAWYENGSYSPTGRCFDIGVTTRQALAEWRKTNDPIAGPTSASSAGNGSLMRLAPVAVRHWRDRETLIDTAARQSKTTHGATESVAACLALAELLADAIQGLPGTALLRERSCDYAGAIGAIMVGSWRFKHRDQIRSSGYVAHSLEAAMWCVGRTANFRDAVLLAANLGDDADTTAAITGQLAGAIYGASAIPSGWLAKLAWRDRIVSTTNALFDAGNLVASEGSN